MTSLARRKYSAAALVLTLGAIAAELAAKHHASLGMVTGARATVVRKTEPMRSIASWHASRSDLWNEIGLGLILLAVVCWVAARVRGEAAPRGAMIPLLVVYLLLFLVMV